MRRFKIIGAFLAAALLAAACSSSTTSSTQSNSSGPTGTLTIDNESGSLWTCGFNPFNLSNIGYSFGNVYEPLAFVNTLQNAKESPWLATKWTWSNGNKNHLHHPQRVKWTDGSR
jgi:peptide/nickel transport system substrate-binding protein